MSDHAECKEKAKRQRIAVPDRDHEYTAYWKALPAGAKCESPSEFHWRRVRETMPPYFYNGITLLGAHPRCVWCNEPL